MSRRWLGVRAALLAAGVAVAAAAWDETGIEVVIERPGPQQPVFGEVEVIARVLAGEPLEVVRFFVDGTLKAEFQQPPFRARIELGDTPSQHRIVVQARGVSGATASASVVTPRMHITEEVTINLQQLYVAATDGSGAPVRDLDREEFEIRDSVGRIPLVTFERGEIPFTAVILLDGSASMLGEKLEAARRGAAVFARGMGELDEVKLVVFSHRLRHLTPFTTVPEVLLAGLGGVTAEGGTALNDQLFRACRLLEVRQGRRVVVLLSDGIDSHSVLRMNDVVDTARRSQAIFYWLHLPVAQQRTIGGQLPSLFSLWKDAGAYRDEYSELLRMVGASGGRIIPVNTPAEIEPAFREILRELRDQYVLGFYPRDGTRGRWQRVTVRVPRAGVAVRTAQGFLGS